MLIISTEASRNETRNGEIQRIPRTFANYDFM